MIKNTLQKLSYIGINESDTENEKTKKVALTLLPFYVSIAAFFLSLLYLYFGNFNAFLIPFIYIFISVLSSYYLYKTKNFLYFERVQLMMILLLPFILMWILVGLMQVALYLSGLFMHLLLLQCTVKAIKSK